MRAVNLHKVKVFPPNSNVLNKSLPEFIQSSVRIAYFLFDFCLAFSLDFRPSRGIYDLQIKNTSYNRDNGRFECRIKAKGTGADVHQEFYNLTVLTAPHPPMVTPGNLAVATEEKPLELTCSSIGGSPDPMIT